MFENFEEINDTCFLCGESLRNGSEINEEHIFPQWVLRKHQITGNVARCIGNVGGSRDFWRTKTNVHSDCNERFGKNLEEKLASGRFNDNELWLWVMKIVCGLFFHDCKSFHMIPGFQANAMRSEFWDLFVHFWEEQTEIFENGEPAYFCPFTIIEIDFLYKEERFFHLVHFDLGVFWLVVGNRCFVVFFRDKLSDDEVSEAKENWDKWLKNNPEYNADSEIQFIYNTYVSSLAIDLYFSRRSQYWEPGMSKMEFDRPERTIELENQYFNHFEIEPVRENGRIVGYRGKPHSRSNKKEPHR